MMRPRVLLSIIALALFAVPLSGCIQVNETAEDDDTPVSTPTDREPPDTTVSWYNQTGIQCEQPPWEEWAQDTGYEPRGASAEEPYVNDEKRADTIRAYYASKDVTLDGIQAYKDDRFYAQFCGNQNNWHYWVKTGDPDFRPAEDGWTKSDRQPETSDDDQSLLGTRSET